jgi:hypothetical protein
MFTLRRFERPATVALLWGDRWWLEGRAEPISVAEPSRAAETLLAGLGESRPARLRLLYQPTSFVSIAAACPMAGRTAIRDALQEEHPALGREDCAWGYEPIAVGPQMGATLLHYETEPGLHALVAALHAAGIAVEGAWPLASALNLVPLDWPDTGALTVVAVAERQTFVYRHSPGGLRETHCINGDGAATLASQTAREASQRADTALHVVAFDPAGEHLATALTSIDDPGGKVARWPRVVDAARTLAPHQPNQLLATSTWWTAARAIHCATAAVLLAACVLGGEQALRWSQQQRLAAVRTAESGALMRNLDALRANETEAHRLREEIAALRPGAVACGALLRALPRELPPQIVLTRVRADDGAFTVEGGVASAGLTAAAWRAWQTAVGAETHPWRLAAAAMPGADFTLKGQWR